MRSRLHNIGVFAVINIIAIALDRYTKLLAEGLLKGSRPFVILNNILELVYTENRGAAFGIMQEKQLFFLIITIAVMLAVLYVIIKIPGSKRYSPLLIALSFVFAGAVGNLIDRITNSYVIDFIYFMPINFPVFNVADIYVTLSAISLILLFFFVYKEEELSFLSLSKSKRS